MLWMYWLDHFLVALNFDAQKRLVHGYYLLDAEIKVHGYSLCRIRFDRFSWLPSKEKDANRLCLLWTRILEGSLSNHDQWHNSDLFVGGKRSGSNQASIFSRYKLLFFAIPILKKSTRWSGFHLCVNRKKTWKTSKIRTTGGPQQMEAIGEVVPDTVRYQR